MERKIIQIVKKFCENFFPLEVYLFIATQYHRVCHPQWMEKFVSFGSLNPDKKFYVIRHRPLGAGFMANFRQVVAHIEIARERGMIPIVDMENYKTVYNETSEINGTKNAWEYFFEQPTFVPLREVYKSKNVCLSHAIWMGGKGAPHATLGYLSDSEKLKNFSALIKKEIRLNDQTKKYVESAWRKLAKDDGEILAVMSRGTDYRNLKPKNHHIQPEPEVLLEKAKEIMRQNNIKYCFLNTEERFVFEMFEKELGERLLQTDAVFFDDLEPDQGIMFYVHDRKNARYLMALEYLKKVIIVSRCDYLLCGINGGSVAAIEFNDGKYKGKYIFDLGQYT